jgi:radical SAM protein with 4Fe4S-binding SPASM domain
MLILSRLLQQEVIDEESIIRADIMDRAERAYLSLDPDCPIKRLEEDYIYHMGHDELYEINDEALNFLVQCDGSRLAKELGPEPEFLEFCVEEGILELLPEPRKREIRVGESPTPSLRYLEWLVTLRCNLACAHCYLGVSRQTDFPENLIDPLLEQFSQMGGLRIMVSGGEPLVYPHFKRLNDALSSYPVRAVLLSNGMAITPSLANGLNFHEVQLSLDGMERGHDSIRGEGAFRKVVGAMKAVKDAGLDLSIATMIHGGNVSEFEEMNHLIREMGAQEWSIDYPCLEGNWEERPELAATPEVAAKCMEYGFGGAYHAAESGWTCGRHLAAILPSGELCKCGLFQERTYGSVKDGLLEAWTKMEHVPLSRTECSQCEHGAVCGGGCRFRAGAKLAKDPVMCRFYRV